jgi:hypothetical protein
MNTNIVRTLTAVVTVVIGAISSIGSCITDAAGVTVCTAAWLTPQMAGIAIMVLGAAHIALKLLSGWEGLVNKTVPVVSAEKAGPGTVTATQVSSTK